MGVKSLCKRAICSGGTPAALGRIAVAINNPKDIPVFICPDIKQ
jgi:hypothetical protein